MEALAERDGRPLFLDAHADELRSLKLKLNRQVHELEEMKIFHSESLDKDLLGSSCEDAKRLLSEVDSVLASHLTVQTAPVESSSNPASQSMAATSPPIASEVAAEWRRERLDELLQYGFEVKYLPLARYLQTASKFVSTEDWCAAREEFRFARVFEKYLELRSAKATALMQLEPQPMPKRTRTVHDAQLEEMAWMAEDFRGEAQWKRDTARRLAHEAKDLFQRRTQSWTASKIVSRVFRESDENRKPAISFESAPSILGANEEKVSLDANLRVCADHVPAEPQARDLLPFTECIFDKTATSIQDPQTPLVAPWYEHEDACLLRLAREYRCNWQLISATLNTAMYGGKPIRGPQSCLLRHKALNGNCPVVAGNGACDDRQVIHPGLLERHHVKLGLMRGANTKIITPRSVVPKKISFNVHPSHEAAARKANQNISKLLTPSELAQRRLQRTRLVAEGATGIVTAGGLGIPPIARSTPSPASGAAGNSQSSVSNVAAQSAAPANAPILQVQHAPSGVPLQTSAQHHQGAPSLNPLTANAQQIAASLLHQRQQAQAQYYAGMGRPPQQPLHPGQQPPLPIQSPGKQPQPQHMMRPPPSSSTSTSTSHPSQPPSLQQQLMMRQMAMHQQQAFAQQQQMHQIHAQMQMRQQQAQLGSAPSNTHLQQPIATRSQSPTPPPPPAASDETAHPSQRESAQQQASTNTRTSPRKQGRQ